MRDEHRNVYMLFHLIYLNSEKAERHARRVLFGFLFAFADSLSDNVGVQPCLTRKALVMVRPFLSRYNVFRAAPPAFAGQSPAKASSGLSRSFDFAMLSAVSETKESTNFFAFTRPPSR